MARENDDKRQDLYNKAINTTPEQRGEETAREIWGMLGGSPSNYPKK